MVDAILGPDNIFGLSACRTTAASWRERESARLSCCGVASWRKILVWRGQASLSEPSNFGKDKRNSGSHEE